MDETAGFSLAGSVRAIAREEPGPTAEADRVRTRIVDSYYDRPTSNDTRAPEGLQAARGWVIEVSFDSEASSSSNGETQRNPGQEPQQLYGGDRGEFGRLTRATPRFAARWKLVPRMWPWDFS